MRICLTLYLLIGALLPPAGTMSAERPPRATRPRVVSADLLPAADAMSEGAHPETQAEPHLAVNPLDRRNLVGGWQEQRFADGGARALGYAATRNGGRRWTSGLVPGLTRASGGEWDRATDPWIAFGPDGRAYFSSMTFGGRSGSAIQVNVSTDGGERWGEPVVIYENPEELSDKQAIASDTFPGSRWYGRLYVAWMAFRYEAGVIVAQVLMSSRSTDGGITWSEPHEHASGLVNTGAVPTVGPDGTAYLMWLSQEAGQAHRQIHLSRSRNGGRRWSRPRRIEEIGFRRTRDIREGNDLAAFAVHPETGMLFLLWADARFSGVDQLALMTSTNRGRTWSEPRRVSAGDPRLSVFTPSLAIDGRGEMGITYFRGGAFNDGPFETDLLFRGLGRDGGDPGPEIRVTRRKFDIRDAAYAQGWFLGDYAGLAGLRRGFSLFWVDTGSPSVIRPGRGQADVRSARVR